MMANQMQLKVLFGKKSHGRPEFSKKKQQMRVFFDVIFYVYTRVDNWERARARDWKQKRRILYEEKHAVAVRQWELLTVSRWKWRAVKNKSEHNYRRRNIG